MNKRMNLQSIDKMQVQSIDKMQVQSIDKMRLLSIDKSSDCCIKLIFGENHKIVVKISEQQNCCEVFGMYVMCKNISVKDTLERYIGKELINVDLIFNECEYKYNECDEFGSYRNYSYLNDPNGIFHHFPNEDKDQIIGKQFDDIDKRVAFNLDNKSMSENPIIRLTFKDESNDSLNENGLLNENGSLDIMLYNEHNGYYPHDCYIEIDVDIGGYSLKHTSLYSI
jgi:hypothetical protein